MCTLLIEVEAIVKSRPLATDLLRSEVNSMMPLSPINLLTLKSRVVMPPSGNFTAPYTFIVVNIGEEYSLSLMSFGVDGEKKFLQHFSVGKNGNTIRRNSKVGDIVLLKEAAPKQNIWPMAKIVVMNTDGNGFARRVKLMLGTSSTSDMAPQYLERPVDKLVMLVENK